MPKIPETRRVALPGLLTAAVLFAVCLAGAKGGQPDDNSIPPNYVPSGKTMYTEYCASCHGVDGKGLGPFTRMLKVPPPDLSTLAKRHGGKFPDEYVTNILTFGPDSGDLHGSSDMPVWGPVFEYLDKDNQQAVQQRIRNLCRYLESLQEP
jgi:mono/diheme cytochrome c family protein